MCKKTVFWFFALQTSSAEALPGAAQGANPAVVRLGKEHHPEPPEAGAAAHQGKTEGLPEFLWASACSCHGELYIVSFAFFVSSSEAAGAGWASRGDEGPPSLGAEGAQGPAGAAAERLREDAQQQSGLRHVVGEVRLWQRWVVLTPYDCSDIVLVGEENYWLINH